MAARMAAIAHRQLPPERLSSVDFFLRAQGGGVHLSTTPFREIPFAIREQVHSAAYLSGESGGQLGVWQKRRSVTVRDLLNGYPRL